MKRIWIIAALIALTFSAAYAVELDQATDVQLMEQFLLPNASPSVKQAALVGVRRMFNLAEDATAAECVAALKRDIRRSIRNSYFEVMRDAEKAAALSAADSAASANLWPTGQN